MSRFFYGIKRRRGEGMAAWIVRHDEALLEAKWTLAEAIHEYGPGKTKGSAGSTSRWKPPSRPPTVPPASESGEPGSADPVDVESTQEHETEDVTASDTGNLEAWAWYGSWWNPGSWNDWSWDNSSRYEDSYNHWSYQRGTSQASWDVSETASAQAEKFLPDFVIAWLLLQRSGLEATERSVIVANLKNDFTIEKVKAALKLTWPDEELRRRNGSKKCCHVHCRRVNSARRRARGGLPEWDNPEDDYAYHALEESAQEALAALQDARRTVKDAREQQAQMRRNRNFYPAKGSGKSRWGASRPPLKCFKCGGPHLRKDCPKKGSGEGSGQAVNLVFMARRDVEDAKAVEPGCPEDTVLAANRIDEATFLSLEQIVREGKAIIDGGATSSLGSEEAMQHIAQLNWEKRGADGIDIIPEDTPSFRFGNNALHTCMATALLKLPTKDVNSQMKIHLRDIPGQPVLLSVRSLRSLGTVIDFQRNEAVFRQLNPRKVVTLETTEVVINFFRLCRMF